MDFSNWWDIKQKNHILPECIGKYSLVVFSYYRNLSLKNVAVNRYIEGNNFPIFFHHSCKLWLICDESQIDWLYKFELLRSLSECFVKYSLVTCLIEKVFPSMWTDTLKELHFLNFSIPLVNFVLSAKSSIISYLGCNWFTWDRRLESLILECKGNIINISLMTLN